MGFVSFQIIYKIKKKSDTENINEICDRIFEQVDQNKDGKVSSMSNWQTMTSCHVIFCTVYGFTDNLNHLCFSYVTEEQCSLGSVNQQTSFPCWKVLEANEKCMLLFWNPGLWRRTSPLVMWGSSSRATEHFGLRPTVERPKPCKGKGSPKKKEKWQLNVTAKPKLLIYLKCNRLWLWCLTLE